MKQVIIIILAMSLLHTPMFAQTELRNLAKSGAKGIFVATGDQIPKPDGPITGHLIERKGPGDRDFKPVAELKAVSTLDEFRSKALLSKNMLPYELDPGGMKLDSIWFRSRNAAELKQLDGAGYTIAVMAALNMLWLDEKVKAGETYTYRVSPLGTGAVLVSAPVLFKKTERLAGLHFDHAVYNKPQQDMSLYWNTWGKNKPVFLETFRSEDGGPFMFLPVRTTFINRTDTLEYLVRDTTVIEGRLYRYYVKGYDAYGNGDILSDTQSIASLDRIQMPLPRQITTRADSVYGGIRISWELADAGYLNMLTIYRSNNSVDGFQPVAVLSPDRNEFWDEDARPATPYFYYFEGVYKTQSVPQRSTMFAGSYTDDTRPAWPGEVDGVAGPDGITISWTYEPVNTEGFWLYRGEPGQPLQLISGLIPVRDTTYQYSYLDKDSSLRGDRFYSYAVKAYSSSHVESELSDTVAVRPVRNIPVPRTPMLISARHSDDRVFITWDNMEKIEENIIGYKLVRSQRLPGKTEAYQTDTIFCPTNMYYDSLQLTNRPIRYRVMTMSAIGVLSRPSVWADLMLRTHPPAAPASITANQVRDGVRIDWEIPSGGEQLRYLVYRYERGKTAVKAGTTNRAAESFTDMKLTKGKRYFYFIVSVRDDDTQSERSPEASILYN